MCVLELPFVDNPYQLFDIIQTQPYTSSTTTALREQLRRTRRPANLLKLASQVMVETWRSHPEVAGILSTWLGNNSDQWQPTPAMKDKMELLCESEISADDWTRVASTNPLAFVLAVKGRPEIYQKALERTLCNRHWRDADAEHALRYYETRGAEVSAIIRHWEEGLRHDLLRAYHAPRIIDLLLAANMALKGRSTQHQLLELLTNQAKALAEGGQMNLARHVAEEVDVLRLADEE